MALIVASGSKIPLSLQLPDGATDRYVRAVLRDPDGVAIGASPVNLAHVGEGKYTNDAVNMTGDDFLTVAIWVYSDAGYSVLDTDYGIGDETIMNETAWTPIGIRGIILAPDVLPVSSFTYRYNPRMRLLDDAGTAITEAEVTVPGYWSVSLLRVGEANWLTIQAAKACVWDAAGPGVKGDEYFDIDEALTTLPGYTLQAGDVLIFGFYGQTITRPGIPSGTAVALPNQFIYCPVIADAAAAPTAGEIDTELTSQHGAGAWTSTSIVSEVVTISHEVLRSETNVSMNRIIVRTFADGIAADVTSVWLEDSTDTYGMKETVSGDSLFAAGTVVTNTGTGVYEIDFGSEAGYDPELAYTYAVKVINNGQSIYMDDLAIDAIVAIGVDTCEVRVDTTLLTGIPKADVDWVARVYIPPEILEIGSDQIGVLVDEITESTNALGVVVFTLLRDANVVISCDDLDFERRVQIPDAETANLFDLEEI